MTTILENNPTASAVQPAAAVTWIGTSGNWYDAANWSTGKVPTSNDLVTIENKTKGTTYDISFSQGNPAYAGLNLLASNGGSLKLSGLTSYQGSSQSDVKIAATGAGSLIDLSDVTSVRGGKSLNVLNIETKQGGDINFSGVTKINGGTTEVSSDGAGSTIDFANLTEFIDDDFDRSLLKTRSGGFINLAKVTKLEEVDLNTDNSVLYLENLTTYVGDNNVDATNGGQISLVKLNNVSGQILQVTATGSRSRIVISQQLDASKYIAQEISRGDVIISNSSSDLNYAPIVSTAIPAQKATEDGAFTFGVPANTFVDFDGDRLTYTATLSNGSALPSWLNFNATTRTFSGTPNNAQVGRLAITVKVTDESGSTASTRFNLDVANVNDAPVVSNAIADGNVTAGQNFSLTLAGDTFTDVDAGDTLTYAATLEGGAPLPAWLSFNAATRSFSGIPTNADAGTLNVSVTAIDKAGLKATDTFSLTIAGTSGNNPPIVDNEIADRTATENVLFSFVIPANTFRDIDGGDVLTYTATLADGSPLPSWLSFDATTGAFSGTPGNADVGTIDVKVTATDTSSASVSDTFVLTIADTSNSPPTVAQPIADQSTAEDLAFTFAIPAGTFSDPGDTLTYTVTGLPAWLTFDATTGIFSGTPSNENLGITTLTVTATDLEAASVSDAFDLTVTNVNDAPFVANPISDQNAVIDRTFSFLVADNAFADVDPGDSLTYTATLEDGSTLPSWLSFDAATRIFTGTAPLDNYGTLNVSVTATDTSAASVSDTFVLNIDINAVQYGASYPDLIAGYGYNLSDLSQHYRDFGRAEGRNPDTFDEYRYVASNPDLLDDLEIYDPTTRTLDGDAAAKNYIESGYGNGRSPISFQADQYLASYGDLIAGYGYDLEGGTLHYIQYGASEDRASDTFDEYRYLAGYDDLLDSYGTDVVGVTQQYILAGSEFSVGDEGRDPFAFKSDIYIASYGDLIEGLKSVTDYSDKLDYAGFHYVTAGRGEGRAKEIFNPTSYLANNPDLAAYGSSEALTQHYIEFGYDEDRTF